MASQLGGWVGVFPHFERLKKKTGAVMKSDFVDVERRWFCLTLDPPHLLVPKLLLFITAAHVHLCYVLFINSLQELVHETSFVSSPV